MTPPVTQQLPKTRRWTRVEYDRLIELGVFAPEERLELLDGLLVVREPQGSRHSAAIRRLTAMLRDALGATRQIDSQLPIALDDDSEPEPDISVVPQGPRAYTDAHPTHAVLIVEIAESRSRRRSCPSAPRTRLRGADSLWRARAVSGQERTGSAGVRRRSAST
jgi:Uma2 family endonuclease